MRCAAAAAPPCPPPRSLTLPLPHPLPQNDFSRFKNSFIKQFVSIEHKRLLKAAADADAAEFVPLLAVDAAGACLGSLDVRPNYAPGDAPGPAAYVNNVVVAPAARGRGVGRRLVEAAKALAAGPMGAEYLYAHMESVNDTASHLYARCGFAAVGTEGGVGGGTAVGQQTLLRCALRGDPELVEG